MRQSFEISAEFYEVLANRQGRLVREGPFLLEQLEAVPGNRVIDLACGVGLHAGYLSENGAEVVATDVSEGMIAHAREHRPHPNVTYHVADMRTPPDPPWALALCLGNSLSLLPGRAAVAETFAAVYDGLLPKGRFVVQVLNYAAPMALETRHRVTEARAGDAEVTAIKTFAPHEKRTFLSLSFFAERGGQVKTLSETAVLRHVYREELEDEASAAGFSVAGCLGSYGGGGFDRNRSVDLIMMFEKPA